jgi:hypothetical protein
MKRSSMLVLLAASVGLVACSGASPEEVRSDATEFPVTATWSGAAASVAPSTVSGTLTIAQHLGFRMDASFSITGTPNKSYQWRLFRGDCATTVPAATSTSATGLLLVATIQSYPDIAVGSSGTGTSSPAIAGYLDSLSAYSVRVRLSQQSTNWNGTSPIACGNLQRSPAAPGT